MLLEQDKVTLKLPEHWKRWKCMSVSSVGGKWSPKWVWSWKGLLFTVTDVSTNGAIVILRVRLINCWEATSDCNHTNNENQKNIKNHRNNKNNRKQKNTHTSQGNHENHGTKENH